jgi:hypothetical protein
LAINVTTDAKSFGENWFEVVFKKNANGLINAEPTKSSFVLFPNPANEQINIALAKDIDGNYTYAIYNKLGEEVNVGDFDFNNRKINTINIQLLNSGVYFIRLWNSMASQTIKFIK